MSDDERCNILGEPDPAGAYHLCGCGDLIPLAHSKCLNCRAVDAMFRVRGEADHLLAELEAEDEVLTGEIVENPQPRTETERWLGEVRWTGSTRDYFDQMEAINRELASGIARFVQTTLFDPDSTEIERKELE